MNTHPRCTTCDAPDTTRPTRAIRLAAVGLAWFITMFYVFLVALMGPLMIAMLPLLVPGGIGMITAAHDFAFGERACETCEQTRARGATVKPEPLALAA